MPLVGMVEPAAGIELTGIIGVRLPGVMVIVVGIGVAVMPEVIIWPPAVGVAHCPLAHGAAADVVFEPQQVLHPTAPKSTRPATPAACRSFFIGLSPVRCPPVAKSPRLRTFGLRSARSRRV